MKRFWRDLACVSLVVVLAGLLPMPVAAKLSEEQLYFYGQNNILFYNPTGSACINGSLQYATGASSYGNFSAQQISFIETYHDIAVQNSINYGIPWETVVAQGIEESAAGTSYFAIERNNFFGIGAFDSNPNNAYSYDTPEAGWEGYYKNIQVTATYRQHGVFDGDAITNPYAYLVAIKAAGYATDPNYVDKVSKIIAGLEHYSNEKGWDSSLELANKYPEWYTNAEANRQGVESMATTYVLCGGNTNNSGSSGNGNSNNNSNGGGSGSGGSSSSGGSGSSGGGGGGGNSSSGLSLVSGGMTLNQAERFMSGYREESNKFTKGNLRYDGAFIKDSGCPSGTMNNCSAFTQWFLNRYTTLGGIDMDQVGIVQGSKAVSSYLSRFANKLIDGEKTPRVYAIVSMGPKTGKADGWSNHTGIVLGINKENDEIIIGEASCGSGNGARNYAPRAGKYSLKKFTNNSSKYGPVYAYTDNVLKEF